MLSDSCKRVQALRVPKLRGSVDKGFSCELDGALVAVKLKHSLTNDVLEACQLRLLDIIDRTGCRAVLFDLTGMDYSPAEVLRYQLNSQLARLEMKRAIVVPNAQIAHWARRAFGHGEYRLFYGDVDAAKRSLMNLDLFAMPNWHTGVLEERRVRDRRVAWRGPGGRRELDWVTD